MDNMGSPCSITELDLGVSAGGVDDPDDGEEMSTASLAEVLATRGRFLEELELWALCRECCLTLEYVNDCHDLFQSLCISPDTVAFDPDGNVCFLDLDMEPEAVYVSPESTQYGEHTFKSHLFSLGMTLLFATEYNTGSDDPRAEISDTFTDLLTSLTQDDSQLRPDLDTVIEASEKRLGEESSQDICLRIVGLQPQHGKAEPQALPKQRSASSSIQQMSDELSAYLNSQSGLVDSTPLTPEQVESDKQGDVKDSKKDVNDNSVEVQSKESQRKKPGQGEKVKLKAKEIVRDVSFDEEDSMLSDLEEASHSRRARKQKGIMLNDLLSSIDRYLNETELWSLCGEAVLTLQRKKKHLPAYVSLDTVMVRESGTISFKAIPEEKPLEVIYMAPELQTKGVLNEKTCLYGLGITLRSCTGGKYTSSRSLPGGEALEILLSSFLQLNQHKRPTLNTALEMCEEYQKANTASSRDVCQRIYREALEAAMTKSEGSSQEPTSKNSWDESEVDQTTLASTDNTRSLAQAGDTTEAEDNIDDIPYDDDQDDTNPAAEPAFKTLKFTSQANMTHGLSQPSSAFKPVAVKAKPARKLERVPSAFSSPATHFKPIVIQDKGDGAEARTVGAKETGVVSKLREIKDNLQRHRSNEGATKETKNSNAGVDVGSLSSPQTQQERVKQADQAHPASLDQAMLQLQAQGNLPNTDTLASAIAHYLKSHLSGGIQAASCDQPQTNVQASQAPVLNHPHFLGNQNQHQQTAQSMNAMGFAPFPNNASTIPSSATSITMSTYSSSASSPMYPLHPQHIPASYSPGAVPVPGQGNPSIPATNIAPIVGQYPPSLHGLGQMPVQFTLVQDPATGLMQMVPYVMPVTSQAQPPLSQAMPVPSPSQYPPASTGAQLYGVQSGYSLQQNDSLTVPKNNSDSAQPHREKQPYPIEPKPLASHPHVSSVHVSYSTHLVPVKAQSSAADSKETASPPAAKAEDHSQNVAHQLPEPGSRLVPPANGGDNDSQTSSPSPSKDSGICVSQQAQAAAYSKDPLMERLLSSQDSYRQRTLSQVLRIIREEFADDGVFDSGVEDLAIAEYIMSLSSLTWETFRCAITEKFFHLVWTYDLLAVLYEAIGGSPSPQFRNIPKTPPTANKKTHTQGGYSGTHQSQPDSRLPGSNAQDLQHHQETFHPGSRSSQLETTRRQAPAGGAFTPDTGNAHHHPGTDSRLPNRGAGNQQTQQRPRSEVGGLRGLWSETSDSTDTETRDKRRRFKKRGELDKSKSSSLHNISVGLTSGQGESGRHGDSNTTGISNNVANVDNRSEDGATSFKNDFYTRPPQSRPLTNTESPASLTSGNGGQGFNSKNYSMRPNLMPSSATHTPVLRASDFNSHAGKSSDHRGTKIGSPAVSVMSHSSSKSGSSQEHVQGHKNQTSPSHTQGGLSPRVSNILPSKPIYPRNNQYASSHLLFRRDYPGSSSSNSPNDQVPTRPQSQSMFLESSVSASNTRSHTVTSSTYTDNDDDTDQDRSAEMRRLAAQKPELFQDTRTSKGVVSTEKPTFRQTAANPTSVSIDSTLSNGSRASNSTQGGHKTSYGYSNSSQTGNDPNFPTSSNRYSVPEHVTGAKLGNTLLAPSKNSYFTSSLSSIPSYEPSSSASKTRSDNMSFNSSKDNYGNRNGSNNSTNHYNNATGTPPYGRSLSAVYTRRHQSETGVVVTGSTTESSDGSLHQFKSHHRRGSDGSVHLPELNSALLPYSNKGQIVYHSAMIQLSLTSEVDDFIHSIDEENKRAIEMRLASIKQEITVQHKQRKKTQRYYRKLNEQSGDGKTSKGDQAISEQMLKDMTEMTRKISFLQLCQTHLQMLLAELYGLDSCFLYSLAAAEPGQLLVLQPIMDNQYLQFRTVSTVEAGQMSVLQAGTPRGLMSYLYTSSALSDGYIHQFLICFRYILTADQLLNFILEKFRSAQSHHNDLNLVRVLRRSMDLLHVWLEGYYSIDFANNKRLLRKLADFLTEQNEANVEGAEELFSLYAACRMGEHSELMLATEMDEDEEEGASYFLHLTNPKRWESFRSLLRRSKSEKGSSGSSGKSRSDFHGKSLGGLQKSAFDLSDCPAHTLAEQLTLLEQETFRKCHPIHFLNSQSQGVGVALSIPGLRTPSMSRKLDTVQASKKGLFVGDPLVESYVVHMIAHSQEVSHWIAAEVLSCGSNKSQTTMITKFLTTGHLCLEVKNYATGIAILEGLENFVVRQLPVWKNVASKYMTYLDEMTKAKMKLKGESLALMSEKDCHVFPTIPSALFLTLHLQQAEIGGFTLANGMFKWDKMRCISEIVDQARIFRDHEYGFRPEPDIQRALRRRLEDFSDQDLHTVASSQDNNFRRHSSSSSLTGTLKKVKDKLGSRKK